MIRTLRAAEEAGMLAGMQGHARRPGLLAAAAVAGAALAWTLPAWDAVLPGGALPWQLAGLAGAVVAGVLLWRGVAGNRGRRLATRAIAVLALGLAVSWVCGVVLWLAWPR
jgi:hypothetical protein